MDSIKEIYDKIVSTNIEARKALQRNLDVRDFQTAGYFEGKVVALDDVIKLLKPLLPTKVVDKL